MNARYIHRPSIAKVKVFMGAFQEFALKVDKKALEYQIRGEERCTKEKELPRMVSFLSVGIPFHKELFPSTISLH